MLIFGKCAVASLDSSFKKRPTPHFAALPLMHDFVVVEGRLSQEFQLPLVSILLSSLCIIVAIVGSYLIAECSLLRLVDG